MGFDSNVERKIATLVVDDEPVLSGMVKSMLELVGGYRVFTINNPEQAWSCLQEVQFGLLITDGRMPNPRDGMKLIEQFSKLPYSSKAGVILMSATIGDLTATDKHLLLNRGWETLPKPFDFDTIVDLAGNFRERLLAA